MLIRWRLRPLLACATALLAGCSVGSATGPTSLQRIGYHGIEILVPATLPISGVTCALPTRSTVIIVDGLEPHCPAEDAPIRPPTGQTIIELSPLYPAGTPAALGEQHLATTPTTLAGAPADIGYQTDLIGATGVLVVPSLQVVVTVTTPTHTETAALLATTRIAPTDQNGCRAHLTTLQATVNTLSPQLVPGTPVSAIACAYAAGNYYASFNQWLLRSRRLNASAAQRAADDIDAMPPGQQNSRPVDGIHARVMFTYADGTHRTIDTIVYTFGDTPLTTDGIHVVQGSDPTISHALGYA